MTIKPTYSELRQALQDIRQLTCGTGDVPANHVKALQLIYAEATKVLAAWQPVQWQPMTPTVTPTTASEASTQPVYAATMKVEDMMGNLTPRSNNSRYNVADMQGNPIPDHVVEGNPFVTPRSVFVTEARCDCGAKRGDLHLPACPHLMWQPNAEHPPQSGNLPPWHEEHSPTPAQILDHWLFCRDEYHNNLNNPAIDHDDQEASDAHLQMLDEQLMEMEEAEAEVNRLFAK